MWTTVQAAGSGYEPTAQVAAWLSMPGCPLHLSDAHALRPCGLETDLAYGVGALSQRKLPAVGAVQLPIRLSRLKPPICM